MWPVGAGRVNRRARGSCRQEARRARNRRPHTRRPAAGFPGASGHRPRPETVSPPRKKPPRTPRRSVVTAKSRPSFVPRTGADVFLPTFPRLFFCPQFKNTSMFKSAYEMCPWAILSAFQGSSPDQQSGAGPKFRCRRTPRACQGPDAARRSRGSWPATPAPSPLPSLQSLTS